MILDISDKAKECPICHSKDVYIQMPEEDDCMAYTLYIKCADCGLTGYKNFLRSVLTDDSVNRVIQYWNNR